MGVKFLMGEETSGTPLMAAAFQATESNRQRRQTNVQTNRWTLPLHKATLVQQGLIISATKWHSVERIYLRQRSSDGSVNKTILKPRLTLANT